MTASSTTEVELLTAAARRLSEEGYDVIEGPTRSLLPEALQGFRPDAIAIGREPKLIVEIASERSADAERVAGLQRTLKEVPDWQLYLVLNRASSAPDLRPVGSSQIDPLLDRALAIAEVDTRAALLVAWAALEAVGRRRKSRALARPQSPERLVERLAADGIVGPSDAAFLRSMAAVRNAFAHGDLEQSLAEDQVRRFVTLLKGLAD